MEEKHAFKKQGFKQHFSLSNPEAKTFSGLNPHQISQEQLAQPSVQASSYTLPNPLPLAFTKNSASLTVKLLPVNLTFSNPTVISDILPLDTPDQNSFTMQEPTNNIHDPNNQFYQALTGADKLPSGSIRFGKKLGEGAFGYVYQGQWGSETVALKVIDPPHAQQKLYGAFTPHEAPSLNQLAEALQWEVISLGAVNHPNVVQFHGVYQHTIEGATYLVMTYCSGGTLQHALQKPIPWSKRWQWALEITQGLEAIHAQGLLHRDLKAENVFIDSHYRAQLGDLGVAQMDGLLQETEAEAVQKGLNDKRFIAPENWQNPSLSNQATDLYALGLVFWQILTGKEPRRLQELTPEEGQAWLNGGDREFIPENTLEEKAMASLIRTCWQKEPSKRPDATTLIQNLKSLGNVFHPQAECVLLAQIIDSQIHPQRKHFHSYQSNYATQYALTETADSYWQAREKEDYQAGNDYNPPLKLSTLGETFIQSQRGSLLLLGEAGLGKTLAGYRWADQQLQECFAWCDDPSRPRPLWPMLLRHGLPAWTHQTLENAFLKLEKKYPTVPWFVILDGYDELIPDMPVVPNLQDHLGLPASVPLLISCRPDTVPDSEVKNRFGEEVIVYHSLPFSSPQLLDYLHDELNWSNEDHKNYSQQLAETPELKALLRNPLVLYLLRLSWETVIQKDLRRLTRWGVYEGFIAHTIKTHENLLSPTLQEQLVGEYSDLVQSYKAFFSEVAVTAFHAKQISLSNALAVKKIQSRWFFFEALLDYDSRKRFQTREGQLDWNDDLNQKRRALLTKKNYVVLQHKKALRYLSYLPLQLRANGYEFIHKSLFEYGVALCLVQLATKQSSMGILVASSDLLAPRNLQHEPGVLAFWQEGWNAASSHQVGMLIEPLFKVVTASRKSLEQNWAASNAATLLAKASVSFSQRDLHGVQISGADLYGANCGYTNFSGANLSQVNLRRSYLDHVDFTNANLTGANFGEYPTLKLRWEVEQVAYSRDGRYLAVPLPECIQLFVDSDGSCFFQRLGDPIVGHINSWVTSITFSPDGKTLASGGGDNMVCLWDISMRQAIGEPMIGHQDKIWSVAFSPDGKILASSSADKTVRLWDPHTQQSLGEPLKGHESTVFRVAFSPDGKTLASSSADKTVRLWDISTRQAIGEPMTGHQDKVWSVAFSPDGKILASGGGDNYIRLWDILTRQAIGEPIGRYYKDLVCHSHQEVTSIAFSPDGKTLASGSDDRAVRLWDILTRQTIGEPMTGHQDIVWSVAFSPDGKTLASGSKDKTVRLWNTSMRQVIGKLMMGHQSHVTSIAFNPDGKTLASGSSDNTVCLWDTSTGQAVAELRGHVFGVTSVAFSPDGKTLASGGGDETVSLWDTSTRQEVAELRGHVWAVTSVTFSPDGKTLASGSADETVRFWDTSTRRTVGRAVLEPPMTEHWDYNKVTSVAFSPDGKTLASGSLDGTVRLWDSQTQQPLGKPLTGHEGKVMSVAFSPDGKTLASGSLDGTVRLWNTLTRRAAICVPIVGYRNKVISVAFSPDGKTLASASFDGTVRLLDTLTKRTQESLRGHESEVTSVTFSPDGKQLASGGEDYSICIWRCVEKVAQATPVWILQYRLGGNKGVPLTAQGAHLIGTILSPVNQELLHQRGALLDESLSPTHTQDTITIQQPTETAVLLASQPVSLSFSSSEESREYYEAKLEPHEELLQQHSALLDKSFSEESQEYYETKLEPHEELLQQHSALLDKSSSPTTTRTQDIITTQQPTETPIPASQPPPLPPFFSSKGNQKYRKAKSEPNKTSMLSDAPILFFYQPHHRQNEQQRSPQASHGEALPLPPKVEKRENCLVM